MLFNINQIGVARQDKLEVFETAELRTGKYSRDRRQMSIVHKKTPTKYFFTQLKTCR